MKQRLLLLYQNGAQPELPPHRPSRAKRGTVLSSSEDIYGKPLAIKSGSYK
jgi:hypothetical protein